ncbi:MAG: hypothetical protein M9904_14485 [Chitinophagaceae bacterium]|nr:hypothetical protein [Chitinophagaceae bacterium]MCO5241254.1 hypothetical protein [Chitinophagaceae bacterium]
MKDISLEHLRSLACAAYAGLIIYPEKKANSVIKEFTAELNSDIRNILSAATSAKASKNLEALIPKYLQRYECHLTAWLQSSVQYKTAFVSHPFSSTVEEMLKLRKLVREKYHYFRQWRQRTVNMLTNSAKQTQIQNRFKGKNRLLRVENSEKELNTQKEDKVNRRL